MDIFGNKFVNTIATKPCCFASDYFDQMKMLGFGHITARQILV